MKLALVILYVSMVVWILPIFRQYKTNLFYFFLFLGICDPLTSLAITILPIENELIAVIFAPILFYTINIDRTKPFRISKTEIFIFILAYSLIYFISNLNIILLIIHILIALRAIYRIIIDLHYNQKINIVRFVLAFYMITSVASLLIYLNGDYQALVLFYTNLAFQLLLAVFFSLFSENNPKMNYKVVQST
ncbi:MAG: hypothetical protein HND40_09850 [Ignavibacteriota bacterium]|nr:hypothetical protein [Ignavibacteriota bacterium]MBW7842402.1 hypothetical protein [Ignavibacterium sp.]MCO6447822.1 hypothetical protein [Ignavibacterium album]MCZ2269246.1 hypothetical protein [Ignavibacteriales bacterium]HMN17532.1 hypothetical protein [Ignavibacteriaceae bacterium]